MAGSRPRAGRKGGTTAARRSALPGLLDRGQAGSLGAGSRPCACPELGAILPQQPLEDACAAAATDQTVGTPPKDGPAMVLAVWNQHYEPVAGNLALSALVAALPVIVLLGLLAVFRVRAHY